MTLDTVANYDSFRSYPKNTLQGDYRVLGAELAIKLRELLIKRNHFSALQFEYPVRESVVSPLNRMLRCICLS